MRRKDREVTDQKELESIIKSCKVLRVAMIDGEYPYIIPVNFGYEWQDQFIFYIHGARSGKKLSVIANNPYVAIEMDSNHALVTGDSRPDHFSYEYRSVIGQGVAELVEDPAEKLHGLQRLMEHQVEGPYSEITEGMIKQTSVVKITLNNVSGKQHLKK